MERELVFEKVVVILFSLFSALVIFFLLLEFCKERERERERESECEIL